MRDKHRNILVEWSVFSPQGMHNPFAYNSKKIGDIKSCPGKFIANTTPSP